ncbi:MAG TPA: hypothetical protein PKV13_06475 [Propionicimonas sp.]|nr:hypothetical protein [Propionicimonas sp.]HRA06251.1 hypothetical protein [Propionicimonas sp.]
MAAFLFTLGGSALPAVADTPTPAPVSTASPTATSTASADDAADVVPDNSGLVWALGGAGALAVLASAVVFLRKS